MCYYITIGIQKNSVDVLKQELSGNFAALPNKNISIAKHLSYNDLAYNIIVGMCSCGLYDKPQNYADEINKFRQKYESNGWSKKKIERALLEKFAIRNNQNESLRRELGKCLYKIAARTGHILLIVHWYTGSIETEVISIKGKVTKNREEVLNYAENIAEDVIAEIL